MTGTERPSLVEQCRDNGWRITGQRRVILDVIEKTDDHPDVEELHRRIRGIDPGVNIATVYRTLNKLADENLIERHMFDDGRLRYEPAPDAHHDHFIDVETGEVIEFVSEDIERMQDEIARKHGFEIVSHKLEIYVKRRP